MIEARQHKQQTVAAAKKAWMLQLSGIKTAQRGTEKRATANTKQPAQPRPSTVKERKGKRSQHSENLHRPQRSYFKHTENR